MVRKTRCKFCQNKLCPTSVRRHQLFHCVKKPVACDCGFIFLKPKRGLQRCPRCKHSKKFVQRKEKKILCHCGKRMVQRSLKRHMQAMRCDLVMDPTFRLWRNLYCFGCDKDFQDVFLFEEHILTNKCQNQSMCKVCGIFRQKDFVKECLHEHVSHCLKIATTVYNNIGTYRSYAVDVLLVENLMKSFVSQQSFDIKMEELQIEHQSDSNANTDEYKEVPNPLTIADGEQTTVLTENLESNEIFVDSLLLSSAEIDLKVKDWNGIILTDLNL